MRVFRLIAAALDKLPEFGVGHFIAIHMEAEHLKRARAFIEKDETALSEAVPGLISVAPRRHPDHPGILRHVRSPPCTWNSTTAPMDRGLNLVCRLPSVSSIGASLFQMSIYSEFGRG